MATRRERVVLDLESNFVSEAARAAAAIKLLNHEVNSLSKGAVSSRSANRDLGDGIDDIGKRSASAGKEVDKLSGRLRIFADVAAILGPGLIPIGAVGIPAITGLASSMGFAALAAGTMVGAFQGVGDALKAVNKAALEPTAANIQAAQIAMEQISPSAREFVRELQQLEPALKGLRDTAAQGMFPGFTEGLDALITRLPDVQRIVAAVAGELGDIGASTGKSLASARWDDFFKFLANEAPQALHDTATAAGNLGHAMAELWMAFTPLNNDFSSWMVNSTKSLDEWATGLSKTQGFQEFIDYVRTNGPQVEATFAAIGNAILQIVEAAAPLGGPVLQGLEAVAKAIAAIADSDLGTPIFTGLAALSLYNRALQMTGALSKKAFGEAGVGGTTGGTMLKAQADTVKSLPTVYRNAAAAQLTLSRAQSEANRATGVYNAQLQTMNTLQSKGLAKPTVAQLNKVTDSLGRVEMANHGVREATAQAAAAEAARSAALRGTAMVAGKSALMVGALAATTSGLTDKMHLTNTATLGMVSAMMGVNPLWGVGAGLLVDLSHGGDAAAASLTGLNTALRTGDIEGMNKSLREFNAQLVASKSKTGSIGEAWGQLRADFGAGLHGYRNAQSQAEANQASARGAINGAAAAAAGIGLAQLAKGFMSTAAGAKSASQSVTEFRNAVLAANAAVTRQGTLDAYTTSLLDAKKALSENGATLDRFSRAGLANRAVLRTMSSSALEFASNMKDAGRRTQFLDNARSDLIAMAMAMGKTGPQAQHLADSFGLIDRGAKTSERSVGGLRKQISGLKSKIVEAKANGAKESSPQVQKLRAEITRLRGKVVDAKETGATPSRVRIAAMRAEIARLKNKMVHMDEQGASAAAARIASLNAQIAALHSKSIVINSVYTSSVSASGRGPAGITSAKGNILHFANGDIANRHMPELAGPGVTRVWREPETQGEAYIPLANDDRRPRARAIAQETVSRLGGDPSSVRWFAKGGTLASKTVDELYAQAKKLGIDGRSTMNKAELIRAISAALRGGASDAVKAVAKASGPSPQVLTRAERQRADKAFNIGTLGVAGTRRELRQFESAINHAGGHVTKNFDNLSRRIIRNAAEFSRLGGQIKGLRDKQSSAREAGVGAFNNDIFGGTAASLKTQLQADRNDAKATAAAISLARSKGLKGDLAAGIAGSGNAALAQEFASMTRSQLATYQTLYAQRASAQQSLGAQAAAAYTSQIAALVKQQHHLTAVLNRLEHRVERGVRNGFHDTKRTANTKAKARG